MAFRFFYALGPSLERLCPLDSIPQRKQEVVYRPPCCKLFRNFRYHICLLFCKENSKGHNECLQVKNLI